MDEVKMKQPGGCCSKRAWAVLLLQTTHDDNAGMEALAAVDTEMQAHILPGVSSRSSRHPASAVVVATCLVLSRTADFCSMCAQNTCISTNSTYCHMYFYQLYILSHCHACCCQELLFIVGCTVCLVCKSCSQTMPISHKGCNKGNPLEQY